MKTNLTPEQYEEVFTKIADVCDPLSLMDISSVLCHVWAAGIARAGKTLPEGITATEFATGSVFLATDCFAHYMKQIMDAAEAIENVEAS